MKQVLFLLFVCLLPIVCNAQRLNKDGLKMVSKVSVIGGSVDRTIEFSYDRYDNLKGVTYTYTMKYYDEVYKDVLTKDGNTITQKSYMNGKPYNRDKYEYKLNEDGKITYMGRYQYSDAVGYIFRNEREIYYSDNRLSKVYMLSSWKEPKADCYYYEATYYGNDFSYNENGYSYNDFNYSLTEEQRRKYAPNYTEYEFEESRNNLKRYEQKTNWKQIYNTEEINDANIGLYLLYKLTKFSKFVYNQGVISNPLFITEWIGFRENNLVKSDYESNPKRFDIEYIRDEKGNIVQMNYTEYYNNKYRGNPFNVYIEYVY